MVSPPISFNGNATDGPSAETLKALDVVYPRRSEIGGGGAGEALPIYAGGLERPHTWTAPVYNAGSPVVALICGLIAAQKFIGLSSCHIVYAGDSKVEGLGGGTFAGHSMVGQVRRMLGAVEGFITAQATGQNNWDDRWSTTGFERTTNTRVGVVENGSGNSTVTFTSDFAHTGGSFLASSKAGGSVAVTIDGGAPQTLTLPAGGAETRLTPAVTGNTQHVWKLASTLPDLHLIGFEPVYNGPRLKVTNLGVSGSSASGWLPGAYTAVPGTGLWETFQKVAGDAAAVFVGLGTNVPGDDGPANAANLAALYAQLVGLGVPVVALAPGGIQQTSARLDSFKALWDAADRHNLPLIDFTSVIGDQITASQRGLMYDATHENAAGYVYEAAAVTRHIGLSG